MPAYHALPLPHAPAQVVPAPAQAQAIVVPAQAVPAPAPHPIHYCNARIQNKEQLARKPFDHSQPVHSLGKMDVKCEFCGALHWLDERISNTSKNSPKFGMCCFSGKISLPKLHNPPPELNGFLRGMDDASKKFRKNIWKYNNALAMTSIGVTQDHAINQGGGPWLFKIQGMLSHLAGSLLPADPNKPTYAQLYIYDPAEALNHRMAHNANKRALLLFVCKSILRVIK